MKKTVTQRRHRNNIGKEGQDEVIALFETAIAVRDYVSGKEQRTTYQEKIIHFQGTNRGYSEKYYHGFSGSIKIWKIPPEVMCRCKEEHITSISIKKTSSNLGLTLWVSHYSVIRKNKWVDCCVGSWK